MKIPINLASQPFRRDRAMFVASVAVGVALVATLGVLFALALSDRKQLGGLRGEVGRLDREIAAASAEQTKLDGILRLPQNSSVLERSVFINTLIQHKAISWSQLFTDMEKILPYNSKLVALHPYINSANQVKLDITLGSQQPDAMIGAIKAFENSPRFGTVNMGSQQPPTQAEPLYRFHMTVNYAQKI